MTEPIPRLCEYCGKALTKRHRRFCCRKCWYLAAGRHIIIVCAICGRRRHRRGSHYRQGVKAGRQFCCSSECASIRATFGRALKQLGVEGIREAWREYLMRWAGMDGKAYSVEQLAAIRDVADEMATRAIISHQRRKPEKPTVYEEG